MTGRPRWISKKALLMLHEESLAMFGGASAVPELKKCFEDYLLEISRGKDPTKSRVVLE